MAEHFNHHFIKVRIPILLSHASWPNISSSLTPSNATSPDASPSYSPAPLQSFSLQAVTESEVLKELLRPFFKTSRSASEIKHQIFSNILYCNV
jgi:hypothetical protein